MEIQKVEVLLEPGYYFMGDPAYVLDGTSDTYNNNKNIPDVYWWWTAGDGTWLDNFGDAYYTDTCQFAVMKADKYDENKFIPKIQVHQPTLFTWHQIYDDAGEDIGEIHYSHPIQYTSLKRGAEARLAMLIQEHNE